jgi:hypothetical protein
LRQFSNNRSETIGCFNGRRERCCAALLSSVLEEEGSEIQQEKYDQHMAALRTQLQALDAALARNTTVIVATNKFTRGENIASIILTNVWQ